MKSYIEVFWCGALVWCYSVVFQIVFGTAFQCGASDSVLMWCYHVVVKCVVMMWCFSVEFHCSVLV